MTTYRIRFNGPVGLALGVATAIADADAVELTSSTAPIPLDDGRVTLEVTADGSALAVAGAVDRVREGLPAGASIEVVDG